jgi:hypothetical protein
VPLAGSGAVFGCGSVPLSISEELSVFCGEIHQLRMAESDQWSDLDWYRTARIILIKESIL